MPVRKRTGLPLVARPSSLSVDFGLTAFWLQRIRRHGRGGLAVAIVVPISYVRCGQTQLVLATSSVINSSVFAARGSLLETKNSVTSFRPGLDRWAHVRSWAMELLISKVGSVVRVGSSLSPAPHRAPCTCRAVATSRRRSGSRCSARVSIMDSAVLTCSRPAGESCSATMDSSSCRLPRTIPASPNAVLP
jgi:hypothetical protein